MYRTDDGETFRRNLHKQLQRSTLIERAIDQCQVIVWATDLEGEVILCDGGGIKELGEDFDRVGMSVGKIPYQTRWVEALDVVRKCGRIAFTIQTESGSIIESFGPLLSPAGRVVGVLAVSTILGSSCQSSSLPK
jgi:hypothetical protein